MSQENVELVRAGFEAWNRRDIDSLMTRFSADVQWRLIGGFADLIGSDFKGRDGVRGFFTDMLETVGGQAEIETVLESDDRVVVIVSTAGTGGVSGTPSGMRWGQVYTFHGGQIASVDNYYEPADALEAVGLSE
jgi:ketosteroid isomerase-like protein